MKPKIIVGPTQMIVSRAGIQSPIVEIGNEHITNTSQIVKETYEKYVWENARTRLITKRKLRASYWKELRSDCEEFKANSDEAGQKIYFDGPNWIISTKEWKHSRHGDFQIVSTAVRNILKTLYGTAR